MWAAAVMQNKLRPIHSSWIHVRWSSSTLPSSLTDRALRLLGTTYGRILDFSFLGAERDMFTKWHSNGFSDLVFVDVCSAF